jgi:putative transposase
MSSTMIDENRLNELAEELAKGVKTEADLADPFGQLMKLTIQKALDAEMENHLGYEKHSPAGRNKKNSRNGYTSKTVKGDSGALEIEVPRDRDSDFDPQIVKKGQRRLLGFDEKIIALYARGQTTRDIASTLKEMYGVDVSHSLISQVTDSILEEVENWQNRPLDSVYPIVYLDCIVIKVHQEKRVIKKAVYLALGVNTEGLKELLGLWISENEGSKFWLSVLTELQNRGVKDIFIASVDGLTGFPEAINTVYPKAKIQLCIVHMVRNSLKYVSYKDRKAVAADLKRIYSSITLSEAELELNTFEEKWDSRYASISKMWHRNWENLITIFDYPDEIRKIIYTTNAIESLNSVIRKAIKNRRIFPNDKSAFKVIYLAVQQASKRWTMPLRNWKPAMNRFQIEYGERFSDE